MASTYLMEMDPTLSKEYPRGANREKRDQIRWAEATRLASIIKAASLFSKQIILSDTQVIENKGLHQLYFHDPQFRRFFDSEIGGEPSVLVGILELRGTKSLSRILETMVQRRLEFDVLQPELTEEISTGLVSYDDFRSRIQGENLIETIDALEPIWTGRHAVPVKLFANYVDFQRKHLMQILPWVKSTKYERLVEGVLRGMDGDISIQFSDQFGGLDRLREMTHFYRFTDHLMSDEMRHDPELHKAVKRVLFNPPYELNFALDQPHFSIANGNTAMAVTRRAILQANILPEPEMRESRLIEVDTFQGWTPTLAHIEFGFVNYLREHPPISQEFSGHLQALENASGSQLAYRKAFGDHLRFLGKALEMYYGANVYKRFVNRAVKITERTSTITLPIRGLSLIDLVLGTNVIPSEVKVASGAAGILPVITRNFLSNCSTPHLLRATC